MKRLLLSILLGSLVVSLHANVPSQEELARIYALQEHIQELLAPYIHRMTYEFYETNCADIDLLEKNFYLDPVANDKILQDNISNFSDRYASFVEQAVENAYQDEMLADQNRDDVRNYIESTLLRAAESIFYYSLRMHCQIRSQVYQARLAQ